MGEHAVRDARLALELRGLGIVDGVETGIDLGIHTGDEHRGDRPDRREVVTGGAGLLQTLEEGFDDVTVPGQGEHEGDVDADPGRDRLGDRGQPLLGGGNLDHRIRLAHTFPQCLRRGDGPGGIMGQRGSDLDRHATVVTVGRIEDRTEQAGRLGDIRSGQGLDGRVDIGTGGTEFGDRGIVVVRCRDRIREDRRIRRHSRDGGVLDESGEIPGFESGAGEVVEPDRDSGCAELLETFTHASAFAALMDSWAASTTAEAVMPNFSYRVW